MLMRNLYSTFSFIVGIVLQLNSEVLDWDCSAFFDHLLVANLRPLNAKLMVCIFWRLLAVLISAMPSDLLLVSNSFSIICNQQLSLILLGGIGYMDQMTP